MQEIFDTVNKFLLSQTEHELIINGPAGSGKTYLLKALIENNILPRNTRYTATTNKAANVLAGVIKKNVSTIFSALHLVPFDDYKTGKTRLKQTATPRIDANVLVIDEAYMLTDGVLEYLKKATGEWIKIIYIGDSYQLPPVFYDISPIANMNIPTITLTKIWRTNVPEIQDLSNRFREAVDTLKFGKLQSMGKQVEVVNAFDFIHNMITTFQTDPEGTKIVGWTNDKVIAYNNFVNKLMNHKDDFEAGDRIVVNNPIEHNGEIVYPVDSEAIITAVDRNGKDYCGVDYFTVDLDHHLKVRVPYKNSDLKKLLDKYKYSKNWKDFFDTKNFFSDIRHTYACTVHKSQGSTYGTVFVDVSDIIKNRDIKETAKLMYVAVSRAADRVVLCMDTSSVEKEVQMLDLLKVYK